MKKAIIVLLLLLFLQPRSFSEDKRRGKYNCAFDYNEVATGHCVFHIATQIDYLLMYDGEEYYMPPNGDDDFTPIEQWTRYIKGKNDAPVIKACNGNKKLLKFIKVYDNVRMTPALWADEHTRLRIEDRLEANQPRYYDDDERFVAPSTAEDNE